MNSLPHLDADIVARLLPMAEAVRALADALRDGTAPGDVVPRGTLATPSGGQVLTMPAANVHGVGVKVATVAPTGHQPRIQGTYLLLDPDSLAPLATIDGIALTALRTPAVSALSTDLLSDHDSRVLVVFGSGPQAYGHVVAMLTVRASIREVLIVGRSDASARALVDRIRSEFGVQASAAQPASVADADIVCTCTTSATPVFDGALLGSRVHVNAVGSHDPGRRELDDHTVRDCAIVVETRQSALAEKGDLLVPLRAGLLDEDAVTADLAQLVRGEVRIDPTGRTVFLSAGMAWQDLVVANALWARR